MGKKKKKAAKELAEPGKPTKDDNVLPKAKAKPPQIDTLVTLVRQLDRKLAKVQRQQAEDREERRGWEQREQERQESAPSPPAPWEAAFASLPEFMAEMRERVGGIESRLQRPPRDPSLDVPASVLSLQRMFAGACKTLGITRPTPAIIGRVMHDREVFAPDNDKPPRSLLQSIYARQNIPDHLSPTIRGLLERYGTQSSQEKVVADSGATPLNQQQQSSKKPKATSSKIAGKLGSEFDSRYVLIKNTGFAKQDPVQSGGKTNYRRYLTPLGRELFNGWPEWTDATGGIGLADEVLTPTAIQTPSESPTSNSSSDAAAAPTQPPT